jgi:hypothetical protein
MDVIDAARAAQGANIMKIFTIDTENNIAECRP